MCGGSPLIYQISCSMFIGFCVVTCRGEYTGRSINFTTLVLPSVGLDVLLHDTYSRCRGDSQGS